MGHGFDDPHFAKQVCFFAPFWVSSPRTWDQHGEKNLFEHLFVLYEVPEFLFSEWFRESEVTRLKWLCWFIILGQGGSLKRASEFFDWSVPAKFSHYLYDAPSAASPTTSMSGCDSSSIRTPALRMAWSSARRMRMLAMATILPGGRGDLQSNPGSLPFV